MRNPNRQLAVAVLARRFLRQQAVGLGFRAASRLLISTTALCSGILTNCATEEDDISAVVLANPELLSAANLQNHSANLMVARRMFNAGRSFSRRPVGVRAVAGTGSSSGPASFPNGVAAEKDGGVEPFGPTPPGFRFLKSGTVLRAASAASTAADAADATEAATAAAATAATASAATTPTATTPAATTPAATTATAAGGASEFFIREFPLNEVVGIIVVVVVPLGVRHSGLLVEMSKSRRNVMRITSPRSFESSIRNEIGSPMVRRTVGGAGRHETRIPLSRARGRTRVVI